MSIQETLKAKSEMIEATEEKLPIAEKKFYETLPVRYYGDYRILGTNCLAIPKLGDMYMPENEDHIACLDYQFEQNRITKEMV